MVDYHYEYPFKLKEENKYTEWIINVLRANGNDQAAIQYIFCSDDYLLDLNRRFLGHDYYTDVITFPYEEDQNGADIFISVDRVRENASQLGQTAETEMRRVMIHGVLHLLGFKDTSEDDQLLMRQKEDEYLSMFHVKQ